MSRKTKLFAVALLAIVFLIISFLYLRTVNFQVLNPAGPISQKERGLIILAVLLSMIVVIPVYFMLFSFAWKYRESNKKAKYDPHFDHSRLIESVWWGVPLIIIAILGIATWKSSNELDPYKPLQSSNATLNIQVVALQWKWLFIYPEQNIATVNLVQFPEKTPVKFEVTADAPINSFWIPQLGSQIYASSGRSTTLHLMADQVNSYQGSSANISGEGFADMTFVAKSVTGSDFEKWVGFVRQYRKQLYLNSYNELAKPGYVPEVTYYSEVEKNLYDRIVNKYAPVEPYRPRKAS